MRNFHRIIVVVIVSFHFPFPFRQMRLICAAISIEGHVRYNSALFFWLRPALTIIIIVNIWPVTLLFLEWMRSAEEWKRIVRWSGEAQWRKTGKTETKFCIL